MPVGSATLNPEDNDVDDKHIRKYRRGDYADRSGVKCAYRMQLLLSDNIIDRLFDGTDTCSRRREPNTPPTRGNQTDSLALTTTAHASTSTATTTATTYACTGPPLAYTGEVAIQPRSRRGGGKEPTAKPPHAPYLEGKSKRNQQSKQSHERSFAPPQSGTR